MTPDEFAVYSYLHVFEPITPAALALALGMQRSTLSNYLRRIADRGDLAREPNPTDGRSAHLQLSPTGHAKVHDAEQLFVVAIRALQANLVIPREDIIGALVALNSTLDGALAVVGEAVDPGEGGATRRRNRPDAASRTRPTKAAMTIRKNVHKPSVPT